jgi:uncharacterized protein
MRLFVDAWDPAYGSGVEDGGRPGTRSNAGLDLDVEVPGAAWRAIDPDPATPLPDTVLFVDGVRRNDARVWVQDDAGQVHPGLAASYAAGVVRCDLRRGVAELTGHRIGRGLFSPSPQVADIGAPPARYHGQTTTGGDPQHLEGAAGGCLSRLEVELSHQARGTRSATRSATMSAIVDDDLLVLDGRLHGRTSIARAVGYVKRHRGEYLSPALSTVVTGLAAGQRTPVFRLSSLYSWYLRLPGPVGPPWAGIVRVECAGDLAEPAAIELADRCALTLPQFASSPYKDPRAPQNLTPIAGLERRLRGLLGDPRLLHRALLAAAR